MESDTQTAIDIRSKYPAARTVRPSDSEIWREIERTPHNTQPWSLFAYVTDKLVRTERFHERTLALMHDVCGRVLTEDGAPRYRIDAAATVDLTRMAEVRKHLDGVGAFRVATAKQVVPSEPGMSEADWATAFAARARTASRARDALPRHRSLLSMFGGLAPDLRHFMHPARLLFRGALIHEPMMGDLAELVALVAALGAANEQDAFYRAWEYVTEAVKTPPIIVPNDDGRFDFTHVCAE